MDTAEALRIIDDRVEKTAASRGADDATRAALRHLAGLGIERTVLVWFWQSLFGENEIGRDQNANASRNRIKLLVQEHQRLSRGRAGGRR